MNTMTDPSMRRNAASPARLTLRVRQIRCEANGINSYELVDPSGAELPQVTAGAHVDVHLDGGIVRQYSLANDPAERHRYVIAVLRDDAGRGGSKALHASLKVRDLMTVSQPRNNFSIASTATRHLLLAGGIGLTPLKAMAHHFERTGADYAFHYCCKGADFAAFSQELAPLIESGHLTMHFDGGKAGAGLDLCALLKTQIEGTHLYYCGPAGFMDACARATSHWPTGSVHFEHFKAPAMSDSTDTAADPNTDDFQVQIASTGDVLQVPESKSIVDVLRQAGIAIETSCEAGLCGTCKVRFLSGDVDHRDFILSDAEHRDHLTVCVSRCSTRASNKLLVLDL